MAALCALALTFVAVPFDHASLPPGLVDEVVFQVSERLTGFEVNEQGWITYFEKAGKVKVRHMDGTMAPQPLLDISEEVGDWNDHGLHGFVYDPRYVQNGFVYAYYVVDKHHLDFFGTPQYDPAANEFFVDTIGRIVRYSVLDPSDPFTQVDYNSRKVLLGETKFDGVPICAASHGIGSLLFGSDGSLLASCGDGELGQNTCFDSGIISEKENVRFWRSQLVDGRNGRVIRIHPGTGEGYPSNPFYNAADPDSAASRTWLLGLRNPYRVLLKPGTGSGNPAFGQPGTLYIGDVGSSEFEEINVAKQGGLNFGWPEFEGMNAFWWAAHQDDPNLDAPNPLFGQPLPGGGICDQQYFSFLDLLVQESLNTPTWPNPCDLSQLITSVPTFTNHRPVLSWAQFGLFPEPLVEVPIFDALGNADTQKIGSAAATVLGEEFYGNCAIAGTWYLGSDLGPQYKDVFFFHDFGHPWIRAMRMDADDQVAEILELGELEAPSNFFFSRPGVEGLWYLRYYGSDGGGPKVQRIFRPANADPVANVSAGPVVGKAPLRVNFDASASQDPEGEALDFVWDFGDGSPYTPIARRVAPTHVYPSEDVTPQATFVSSLDGLSPPIAMGQGSLDPEVLRDGIWPDATTSDPSVQFDTQHVDALGNPDKGPLDWIGWELAEPRELVGLVFQEGLEQPGVGGWFDSLDVQFRVIGTQLWRPVQELIALPSYPGDPALAFEVFQLLFEPVVTDAIRLIGAPGGSGAFVSAAELLVFANAHASATPASFQATLGVIDTAGNKAVDTTLINVDNAAPYCLIVSPLDGATYPVGVSSSILLEALALDPEQSMQGLDCTWALSLVHDNHLHPESSIEGCVTDFTLVPHEELLGDVVYWIVEVTVTDALGLSTTRTSYLMPFGDCNLNGQDDALEIAAQPGLDGNSDGVLDSCQRLSGSPAMISVQSGGVQTLSLTAGAVHAGELYILLGSMSGFTPGLQLLPGLSLPLVFDAYFAYTLSHVNKPPLSQSFGLLDSSGQAQAAFGIQPGTPLPLIGLTVRHAYAMLNPVTLNVTGVSNHTGVQLTP